MYHFVTVPPSFNKSSSKWDVIIVVKVKVRVTKKKKKWNYSWP